MSKGNDRKGVTLAQRDRAEIRRSQLEAKLGIEPSEIRRYLNPAGDSAFSLEYAFSLLGDIQGKRVLDLGCGSGENIPALVLRGADVIALDISHELLELSRERLKRTGIRNAQLYVASAYHTGLPDQSIDIIFSMSLLHHLDIPTVREEMRRILNPDGFIVVKEPLRFSALSLSRSRQDASEYEHPLTRKEFEQLQEGFRVDSLRFFRLPFVGFANFITSVTDDPAWINASWRFSAWIIKHFPQALPYATAAVWRMKK